MSDNRSHLRAKPEPQNLLISQEGWESDHDLETDKELGLADKATDTITGFYGSWSFLWIQAGILVFWAIANTGMLLIKATHIIPWDPYPFVFMNLLLSTEAAFSGILVLMSNNRAAANQRVLADEVRRTTNRAWANTERIESLSEMMMQVIEHNFEEQCKIFDKLDQSIATAGETRQAFSNRVENVLEGQNQAHRDMLDQIKIILAHVKPKE